MIMEVIYIWAMIVVDLKVSLQACMYFELTHLYSRGMQMAINLSCKHMATTALTECIIMHIRIKDGAV